MTTNSQRVLTVNEFIKAYRLSRTTTYKLINNGALSTVLIGKRRLIPIEAAEALLKLVSPEIPRVA
ncbi:MAG: helix-turn-helix domain-containing protein [Xanthobacteraceae bacterium]